MAYFDDRPTASISTHVHAGPCTVLAAAVRTHEDGSPYVTLRIGESDGGAHVYLGPTELDRLINTAVQARVDLAGLTAVQVASGTAWERHDDPTVDDNPLDDDDFEYDEDDDAPIDSGSRLLYAEGWI
ncbi:hypothetical protein EV643_112208 [Kribbella sp. VKM Ac-2527]|uniref:Uncharacterized protein n=2 Tax=Kribbella caucasensis TaxID=2512215 RepID=A0A4R6K8J6_9ACTN|nr:hypothetical protein EV643_112208 [Kribbella sp. VKM Ac-2527]